MAYDVIYQILNGQHYAFVDINNEVYFAKVPKSVSENKDDEKAVEIVKDKNFMPERKKTHPYAGDQHARWDKKTFLEAYKAGQANPTPEAIEKLWTTDEDICEYVFIKGNEISEDRNYVMAYANKWMAASKWLLFEIKRRAEKNND